MLTRAKPDDVVDVRFRGHGWPGIVKIRTKDSGTIRIPHHRFYHSGFGQYFYDKACFVCNDQMGEHADISFADPWTYQRGIGIGKTLVVIRTNIGLTIVERAVRRGYIKFEELKSPLYAVQYSTMLKKAVRVTSRKSASTSTYVLPPSFTTIAHEIDYKLGRLLSRREKLWPLLALYAKARHFLFLPFYTLDYWVKTSWVRVLESIRRVWIE